MNKIKTRNNAANLAEKDVKPLREKQTEQAKEMLRALVKQGLIEDVETAFNEDGTFRSLR